jgi:hypothetical protein
LVDTTLVYPVTATGEVDIQVNSWVDGTLFLGRSSVFAAPSGQAQNTYATDFSDAKDDFFLEGLDISVTAGFDDAVLHSPHPHGDNTDYIATLLVPIALTEEPLLLSYDDVALIEPGEEGTVYGDAEFWDFVVVEGSNDGGASWLALADGYDARADDGWLNNLQGTGTSAMFVHHEISLFDRFAAGDTLIVRFRLSADPSVNFWGWAVDNVALEPTAPTADDRIEIPSAVELLQNFPNPFRTETTLAYSLDAARPVSIAIFDLSGRLVRHLMRDAVQPAGAHRLVWDGSNDAGLPVASGMYLYRLSAGEASQVRRMVLIR